jgi:hypothetical protein
VVPYKIVRIKETVENLNLRQLYIVTCMEIMNAKRTLTFKNLKKRHTHSSYEKSIIELTIQYIKDRTESFDDYFQCQKR